ncbi:hypothetical protein RFI_06490 [Reticulomyxa filosa]|uniref:Uncharacterized protein n=1 Tax=Reticulomyxa filosa TaxID=46433 RepID=X6NWD9_RETFI|nr:hypothetical protein RFI_06490 [Reticulomyxa filosa]|eukprot:ETO30630.1 hypothetical protein RFI_06490 [Reticulomyxa filosa]
MPVFPDNREEMNSGKTSTSLHKRRASEPAYDAINETERKYKSEELIDKIGNPTDKYVEKCYQELFLVIRKHIQPCRHMLINFAQCNQPLLHLYLRNLQTIQQRLVNLILELKDEALVEIAIKTNDCVVSTIYWYNGIVKNALNVSDRVTSNRDVTELEQYLIMSQSKFQRDRQKSNGKLFEKNTVNENENEDENEDEKDEYDNGFGDFGDGNEEEKAVTMPSVPNNSRSMNLSSNTSATTTTTTTTTMATKTRKIETSQSDQAQYFDFLGNFDHASPSSPLQHSEPIALTTTTTTTVPKTNASHASIKPPYNTNNTNHANNITTTTMGSDDFLDSFFQPVSSTGGNMSNLHNGADADNDIVL